MCLSKKKFLMFLMLNLDFKFKVKHPSSKNCRNFESNNLVCQDLKLFYFDNIPLRTGLFEIQSNVKKAMVRLVSSESQKNSWHCRQTNLTRKEHCVVL